jgi:hypothetical protein
MSGVEEKLHAESVLVEVLGLGKVVDCDGDLSDFLKGD